MRSFLTGATKAIETSKPWGLFPLLVVGSELKLWTHKGSSISDSPPPRFSLASQISCLLCNHEQFKKKLCFRKCSRTITRVLFFRSACLQSRAWSFFHLRGYFTGERQRERERDREREREKVRERERETERERERARERERKIYIYIHIGSSVCAVQFDTLNS